MTDEAPKGPKRYEASGAQKTMLSFAFILLLPFFISLPAMLFWRMSYGLWRDTVGLAILAIAFTAIMVFLLAQLMFAIRAHVTIGEKAVALTLPAGQGPTPKLRYQSRTIPYDDVRSVQTRCELYGAPLAPVLLRGARIITKDDERISLGFVNEHDSDAYPLMSIASSIAERAGIEVTDEGAVRRTVAATALGRDPGPDEVEPLTQDEMDAANRQHRKVTIAIVALMGALVAIGITADFFLQWG